MGPNWEWRNLKIGKCSVLLWAGISYVSAGQIPVCLRRRWLVASHEPSWVPPSVLSARFENISSWESRIGSIPFDWIPLACFPILSVTSCRWAIHESWSTKKANLANSRVSSKSLLVNNVRDWTACTWNEHHVISTWIISLLHLRSLRTHLHCHKNVCWMTSQVFGYNDIPTLLQHTCAVTGAI